jgi:predicted metal-dependent phosphoesterase TrpH
MQETSNSAGSAKRMLKVDFHVHTSADPVDNLPLDIVETIENAAGYGYDAIALTHHEAYYQDSAAAREAAERTGVLLIPGIEATVDNGAHVLVVNCGSEIEGVTSLAELARIKQPHHLVIAPHPYYPGPSLGDTLMDEWVDLFDAVEWSYFWNSMTIKANWKAKEFAAKHGKVLLGTGDVHLADQMNHTFALVEAEKSVDSIIEAVRAGRVGLVTEPLPTSYMASILMRMVVRNELMGLRFWSRLPRIFADVYAGRGRRPRRLSVPV